MLFLACPDGWYSSSFSTCYMFVNNKTSWDDARARCREMQADLGVFSTSEKSTEFANLRDTTSNQLLAVFFNFCIL